MIDLNNVESIVSGKKKKRIKENERSDEVKIDRWKKEEKVEEIKRWILESWNRSFNENRKVFIKFNDRSEEVEIYQLTKEGKSEWKPTIDQKKQKSII